MRPCLREHKDVEETLAFNNSVDRSNNDTFQRSNVTISNHDETVVQLAKISDSHEYQAHTYHGEEGETDTDLQKYFRMLKFCNVKDKSENHSVLCI